MIIIISSFAKIACRVAPTSCVILRAVIISSSWCVGEEYGFVFLISGKGDDSSEESEDMVFLLLKNWPKKTAIYQKQSRKIGGRQQRTSLRRHYSTQSLSARYHIWLGKTKDDHPNLTHFICTLKSQYEIETKSGDTKKWKPFTGYMRI